MKLNLVMAQTFQFVISVLFIAMVLCYFGVLLMVPLAVLVYAIKIVSFTGPIISVLLGIGVLGFLSFKVSKMTELLNALLGIGKDLIAFGLEQKQRFEPIIEAARGDKA